MVALEVRVGQETKHVGKVGMAPISSHPAVAGRDVLYKEVPSFDFYTRSLGTFSIDRMGFDYALQKYGFQYLAVYLFDVKRLVIVRPSVVQASPVVDLGERPQYRIPPSKCEILDGDYRIAMGWTSVVVVVDDVLGAGANRRSPVESSMQILFGP